MKKNKQVKCRVFHKWKITKYTEARHVPLERKCLRCGKEQINLWGDWRDK